MRRSRLLLSSSLAAALLAAGCAPTVTLHGFVPPEDEIATITPGEDSALSIEQRIGRPSAAGVMGDTSWYYVQTTVSEYLYNAPEVIDRKVVAIRFDEQGIVTGVDRYGIEDGRIINLNTRVTETNARELGILEQLFGNLFRVDAEQILAN